VLNPSGLEISAASATWTAGALLLFEHADDPPPGLVAVFAASSVVLAATRPLSPLWSAGIIVALVVLRPAAAGRLLRSGAVRVGVAVTAVAVAAATAYVVVNDSLAVERFPLPPGFSNQQVAALVLGLIPEHALSLVGRFGGPEFGAPALAVLVWVVGVGALVCVAVSVGDRWQAAVLALIVLATLVALPFAASFPDARSRGVTWQGRYQYPLAAGVPLVAVAVLGAARTRMGRAGSIAAGAVVIGHLATFYWALRRYTVGLGPSVNAFARVPRGWEPPLPAPLLAALVVVTASAYGAWLAARLARPLPLEAERWAPE
jgi:hypothetical protein